MKSVRQLVVEKIREKFIAVDVPDWPLKFSVVALGPLGDEDFKKRYSIGIVPGVEKYSHEFPYIVRDGQIAIEFRVVRNQGDAEPQLLGEQLLTLCEQLVLRNKTWDGLAMDTQLVGNEIDLVNASDRSVQGVLFISVKFRHGTDDPVNPDPVFD